MCLCLPYRWYPYRESRGTVDPWSFWILCLSFPIPLALNFSAESTKDLFRPEIYNPRSSHSSWIGDGTTLAALQLLSQALISGLRSTPRPFTSICCHASGTRIFANWPAHLHCSKPIHVIFIPSSPGLLFVLYGLTLAAGSLTPLGTLFHLCTLLKKNMGGHTLSSTRERTARSVPQTM